MPYSVEPVAPGRVECTPRDPEPLPAGAVRVATRGQAPGPGR